MAEGRRVKSKKREEGALGRKVFSKMCPPCYAVRLITVATDARPANALSTIDEQHI
jgi:hypothetical protein